MYNPLLKTFITAADTGSFTKAAAKLYITPASVMKQINSLETHIGVQLLTRTNQGIRLTNAGEIFYKEAIRMIHLSDKAIAEVKKAANSTHILRVGTSLLNPCRTFFDLWKSLNEKLPEYQLKIVTFEDDHKNILSTIENLGKTFDFFIGTCTSRSWLERCSFYPLGYHYLSIAAPYGHPLVQYRSLDLSHLQGSTLMMGRRGDSEFIDAFRDKLEAEYPQIHIQDTSYYYDAEVFNQCEQTGSLLLTLDAWEDIHPSLITIPLSEKFATPYGIIYAKDCSDEMGEFIELIRTAANQQG